MASSTPNISLTKPALTDPADIQVLNANADKIDTEVGALKNKDKNYMRGYYVIPGETTELYRIQHITDVYTVVEIAAPSGSGGNLEATLALMREADPDSGGPEFLDLYNSGYSDLKAHGIRIQSRGSGQLRPFHIEFNDGLGPKIALRILPDNTIEIFGNIKIVDASGNAQGHISKEGIDVKLANDNTGGFIGIRDNGSMLAYTPTGILLYADAGWITFNDNLMWHTGNMGGAGSTRPTNYPVGAYFFDTNLGKPIWYKGNGQWVDATGAVV